jgi:hypothetical protein
VSNKLTPQRNAENSAPPRVQTTVSPPRVDTLIQQDLPIKHLISQQLPQNSHRRQTTPHRSFITPQSHGMVRRSARQQNLSQDMMSETLAQANHCFSISTNTKCCQTPIPNAKIVHVPEMENHSNTKNSSQN